MVNDLTDEEMVKRKEDARDKQERKIEIRDAVSNGINRSDLTDKERIHIIERNCDERGNMINVISDDALQLARRILKIGKEVNLIETDVIDVKREIDIIKNRAEDIKEEADRYEIREDKKFEIRRDTILRILAIGVPVLVSVIGLLLLYGRF
jgi:hypothetical protein